MSDKLLIETLEEPVEPVISVAFTKFLNKKDWSVALDGKGYQQFNKLRNGDESKITRFKPHTIEFHKSLQIPTSIKSEEIEFNPFYISSENSLLESVISSFRTFTAIPFNETVLSNLKAIKLATHENSKYEPYERSFTTNVVNTKISFDKMLSFLLLAYSRSEKQQVYNAKFRIRRNTLNADAAQRYRARLINVFEDLPGYIYCFSFLVFDSANLKDTFILHFWFNRDTYESKYLEHYTQAGLASYFCDGYVNEISNLLLNPFGFEITRTGKTLVHIDVPETGLKILDLDFKGSGILIDQRLLPQSGYSINWLQAGISYLNVEADNYTQLVSRYTGASTVKDKMIKQVLRDSWQVTRMGAEDFKKHLIKSIRNTSIPLEADRALKSFFDNSLKNNLNKQYGPKWKNSDLYRLPFRDKLVFL